jgi:hypothetical protein
MAVLLATEGHRRSETSKLGPPASDGELIHG